MKLFDKRKKTKVTLELTPLIDIIFILLIFFAVSTTLITNQNGIQLQLPEAETVTDNKEGLVISIDADRHVFIEKKRIDMDLIQREIKQRLQKEPKLQVILNAHKSTPYALIIQAMDNIRIGGCYDIVLQAEKIK